METKNNVPAGRHALNELQSRISHRVTIGGTGNAFISFDLASVNMTPEQAAIVLKLFNQNPVAVAAEDGHSAAREAGKAGPASKYLSPDEFESIRKLGVRLGTQGVLAAAQCDFCLHCVKLEALPGGGPFA
jgi:hypothetical protein